MNNSLALLFGPVIGAIIAVGGITLDNWLREKREREEKQLDRRVVAYKEILKVLPKWLNEIFVSDSALSKIIDELEEAKVLLVLVELEKAIAVFSVIQQTLLDLGREMSTKRAEGKVFPSKGMSQFESYEKFNKERTKFLEIVRKDIGTT